MGFECAYEALSFLKRLPDVFRGSYTTIDIPAVAMIMHSVWPSYSVPILERLLEVDV